MNKLECLRCGICCHYIINDKLYKCKYLLLVNNTKTICRIYNNRLRVKIAKGIVCWTRENRNLDYEGCPYNNGSELSPIVKVKGKFKLRSE